MDFQRRYSDEVLSVFSGQGLYLAVWRNAPGRIQLEALMRDVNTLRREVPSGMVFVNAIVGGVPKFDEAIRELTARATRQNADWVITEHHIVLVQGFVGVATRAFLSTVQLLSRSSRRTEVHSTYADAARAILVSLPNSLEHRASGLAASLESACTAPFDPLE